jgi:hypothetical protein
MSHAITLSKNQCPLTPNEQERMRTIPYALVIGSIMYTRLCMHPDVSYSLCAMSRYQSNFGEAHWTIIKNILKYLRRTKEVFLVFGGEEEFIARGYTDASLQTNIDDSKSQSGFVFYLNRGAVSWKSSMKICGLEVEYITTSEATKEVVWIRNFVSELGAVPSASSPMDLYCDNSGSIAQTKEHRS